jgi:hypothetical protein
MKRILTFFLGGCWVATTAAWAGLNTIPLYVNWSTVTNVPQVDARAFANYGQFVVGTEGDLYDFMNVLNYTNRGVMLSQPGFLFNHIDDQGARSSADQFVNELGGSIQAFAMGRLEEGAAPAGIYIDADRVVNRGSLITSADGLVQIVGKDVDLRRSGAGVMGIGTFLLNSEMGFHSLITSSYMPDAGIRDLFWGGGEQIPRFASSTLIPAIGALGGNAPQHTITNMLGPTINGFTLPDPWTAVYTNAVDETNWIIQVVLVAKEDTNLNTVARFSPSTIPTNFFRTVSVRFGSPLTNNLGQFDLGGGERLPENFDAQFFLIDRLASETNISMLTNVLTQGMPFRPAALEINRYGGAGGDPPNGNAFRTNLATLVYNAGGEAVTNITTNFVETPVPPNGTNFSMEIVTNIVTTAGYSHDVVTNLYVAAGASVTNMVLETPNVPDASPTNMGGRVSIIADRLNLERAHIRGEGIVTVQARHLVSTKLLSMDVPHLHYDVGATNGMLELQNLVVPEVERLAGFLQAWSAVWTNQLMIITNAITNSTTTNITVDDSGVPTVTVTNDPGTNVITTNVINVGIHVLFVDASMVNTRYPTYVSGLVTHSTNVYVMDTTRVVEQLAVDATSLSVGPRGGMVLGDRQGASANTITDWKAVHFPNLRFLTNEGFISVPDQMIAGADREVPYDVMVVKGTNEAGVHRYRVRKLVNGGLIQSLVGPIRIEADAFTMDGGRIASQADLEIVANTLRLRHSTNTVVRRLVLDVADNLTDSGGDAAVRFTAGLGVQLNRKPALGSLLGTTLELSAARYQYVESSWAAEDRGATAEGFTDNVALGRLILNPEENATVMLGGTGGQNGMYVDYLEFGPSALLDLNGEVEVDPSLTVYFAAANLDASIVTNAFPGRMIWVKDFVGPRSGVDVLLPTGETIRVNRGLRESAVIDSDADGTANGFDLSPFDGVKITDFRLENGTVVLTWRAAAHTRYEVQATPELGAGAQWEVVREYDNTEDDITLVTIEDATPPEAEQRYYRVVYYP